MSPAADPLGAHFVRLRQGLRGYLRRRLPEAAPVDDVPQDVFVKAVAARQTGRDIANLNGWLYAAARTAVADDYRSRDGVSEALDENLPDGNEADALRLHTELSSCLRGFIDDLPAHYRDTLIATELEGRTLRALAEAQGVSVSAIKSRAARGKRLLRARLLACCHVEMQGGLVSDYHRRASPTGDGGCA